jgi:FtsP/CotA-like multicopper oxidase with cupredoxin domain
MASIVYMSITLVAIVLQTRVAYADESIDEVECNDQQANCECDSTKPICHFRLQIEELQTFASYILKNNATEEETRGVAGDTYYFTNTGFAPALPPPKKDYVLEYGDCWYESIPTAEDFKSHNCSIPMIVDGRTYRMFIAVNGQIPGPTLIVTEGQKVRVDVYNQLTNEGVTIHWHGMHQKKRPYMDGVAFVSQAPITPGAVFQYRFVAEPAGTHWYHSHLGAQRTDGLFGALIVREKNTDQVKEKLNRSFEDLPSQHTLTLLDFQREASLSLFTTIHPALGFYPDKPIGEVPKQSDALYTPRTNGTDGIEVGPIPYWSGLINGKGRYNSSTYSLLSEFHVEEGKIYRFRLIGAQSLYAYKVEVVGHKLTVIATDGHFIEPVDVDYIIIHTGERYDFLLNATQAPDNYMIRAQTLEVKDTNIDPNNFQFHDHIAEAVLHYSTATMPPDPTTLYVSVQQQNHDCTEESMCIAVNCPVKEFPHGLNIKCMHLTDLTALFLSKESETPRIPAPEVEFLNFGFAGDSFTSAINGRNFILPATPWQTYPDSFNKDKKNRCEQKCPSNIKCPPCIHTIQIAKNQKYEEGKEAGSVMMVLSALGREGKIFDFFSHPIHLHGHSFHVVHVEHGSYENGIFRHNSSDITCSNSNCNWANGTGPDFRFNNTAIRKDTVIVPAGGYVVIAFQADNPGYWFMHCHMEAHLLEGMAVIVQEYPDDQQPQVPYGINNIGDFLWPEAPKAPTNWWRIGCIIASVIAAVLLIITTPVFVTICCICIYRKLKKKNAELSVTQEPSGNVQNKTKQTANEETFLLSDDNK